MDFAIDIRSSVIELASFTSCDDFLLSHVKALLKSKFKTREWHYTSRIHCKISQKIDTVKQKGFWKFPVNYGHQFPCNFGLKIASLINVKGAFKQQVTLKNIIGKFKLKSPTFENIGAIYSIPCKNSSSIHIYANLVT